MLHWSEVSLALPAYYAEQGLCNGTVSPPFVCPIRPLVAGVAQW